ncbi:unnamed protein product, partial [Rotaria sp. Silwood2]
GAVRKEIPEDEKPYEVEENENSDKEVIIKKIPSSNRTPSATTVTKSKRSFTIQQQIPVSKRLRFSTNDPYEQREYERLNLQQVVDHMKEMNTTLLKLQKQQQYTIVAVVRQDNFLRDLCKNQKKARKKF